MICTRATQASELRTVLAPLCNSTVSPLPGKLALLNNDIYGEERVCGGIISNMSVDAQSILVHVHVSSESRRPWMPSWKKAGKKTQSLKACLEGFTAFTASDKVAQVEMYGALRMPSHLVTEEMFDKMRVKGLVQRSTDFTMKNTSSNLTIVVRKCRLHNR